ncbi:uncharacterized protein LOC128185278 [Crassostrea angulata]|uniref:uncharacterized protein LOC128185278 n=1 Tax=Magallana angulata TaxID=2784310 RepID=UPI0022B14AC0|nr:uncharacterized protein LOC128185278 [Crassostrea angulata]
MWKMQIHVLIMIMNSYPILAKAKFCGIPPMCCAGYKWKSETKSCFACEPGYYGINCNNKCIFPSYGIRCQLECRCKKSICHHSTGCGLFGVSTASLTRILESSTTSGTKEMKKEQKANKKVSSPSTEDVSHSLTTEEMHQDQPLLSNQTTTSSAKTRLETEQTTNAEEMHFSSQENTPWEKNRVLVLWIIGLSCITVVMACLHIGWCVVDVLFMY